MYPFVHFPGRDIPTYGLCMAIGFILSLLWALWRAKRAGKSCDPLLVLVGMALLGAILGAKLFYLLFSMSWEELWGSLTAGDFSVLLNSGQVFYGGLIGGVSFAFLGQKLARTKISEYINVAVPCIPLGHAIGRIGCLMAGCCHGAPYDGPLAVEQYFAGQPGMTFFPIQLVEACCLLIICVVLTILSRRVKGNYTLLRAYLAMYAVVRFSLEYGRGDSIRGIFSGVSTSQWISIGLLAMCLLWIAAERLQKKKSAG